MPLKTLSRYILLPELELLKLEKINTFQSLLHCKKVSVFEVCPRCASKSEVIYDHRFVLVKDNPIRGKQVLLRILKRRFYCKPCKKPFTEPVPGVIKGKRTTQRYKAGLLWACENFSDLKKVRKVYRCSTSYLYKALYEQLELKRRMKQYSWPTTVGIDEHKWSKQGGTAQFATLIVDHKNKRVKEVVEGKTAIGVMHALKYIPGRENVRHVTIDLADPYKRLAIDFFPNAKIIADKFHVLRLLTPAINKRRKAIAGDRRKNPIGKLLLRNGKNLDYYERKSVYKWLDEYPELREVYHFKEALHGLYRIKGYKRAGRAFTKLTDRMALSKIKEIKTLRRTIMKWRNEILLYFKVRLTNARTEGYNNVAKLIQKRAYGYKSFANYRLRLLYACS